MRKTIKYIGLDVHQKSISIAVADNERSSEVRYFGRIDNNMDQFDKILRKFISQGAELRCVYEAGPCGYHLYRHLSGNGIDCCVVAPSKIPRKSGDRLKNDRRDAIDLARLHRAGELTAVYVPDPEDEALRDLVRAREDNVLALRKVKQQLNAFLLRHDIIYSGRTRWSKAHFAWLAEIRFKHPAQYITLQEYLDSIHNCRDRIERLTTQLRQLVEQSRLFPQIKALQSLRGISFIIAVTVIVELGDISRFEHPNQLMAYLGLISSEHSSGPKISRGSITKTGNGHVRKALVEAAQAYRLPARKSRTILKRQEGLPEQVRAISWKAQCRLCGRYRYLTAKGKAHNVAKVAVARELAAFTWAIVQEVPMAA